MSHSFFNSDRSTHFKIVAIALTCSVAVTLFCVLARTFDPINQKISASVIKAKTRIVVTSDDANSVR